MNPTIKDIALKADVSYATVSRALNGKYGVKSATRDRILKIARQMQYRPNVVARGLVTKSTRTLGLVIPDITNPFFPEVAGGAEDEAHDRGYGVFLCNSNWHYESEEQYLALLAERRVDGILLAPISSVPQPPPAGFGIPVVYISNAPRGRGYSFVGIDNIRGGLLATSHLIEAGYRKLGFIGSAEGSKNIDQRFEGFRRALADYGVNYDEALVKFGEMKQASGYNLMKEMLDSGARPRAIFCENDLMALGCIQAIRETGRTVPGDIAVIGFDDIPLASFPDVRLTTIVQPKYAIGKLAAKILLDTIEADSRHRKSRTVLLEPELVVRGTT